MQVENIDNVVKSALFTCGKSIHYYIQFLHYALKCVQELNYDSLKNIKSVEITLASDNTATLPTDYVDWCKVGFATNQFISILGQNGDFSRLAQTSNSSDDTLHDLTAFFYNVTNRYGEHKGQVYGIGNDNQISFKVLPERDLIQVDQRFTKDSIILEYITDGTSTTSTTLVHPYAAQTIEDYIFWKYKANNRKYNRFDARIARDEYYDQLRRLRARMNPLTVTDIVRSLRSGYKMSIKI
tara:strand:- start:10 stop:729 length:720 start_codon:yes stop_codon:yes gene_type:complete